MDNETENNTIEEYENTNTENPSTDNTQSVISVEDRISNIETNVNTLTETGLFFVAFFVVLVVCFLLYKSIDNFISF